MISFNSTISSCDKGHAWQQAIWLFRRFQEAQVRPDDISFCGFVGCWEGYLMNVFLLFDTCLLIIDVDWHWGYMRIPSIHIPSQRYQKWRMLCGGICLFNLWNAQYWGFTNVPVLPWWLGKPHELFPNGARLPKTPCHVLYVGDYTTQFYRDNFISHEKNLGTEPTRMTHGSCLRVPLVAVLRFPRF